MSIKLQWRRSVEMKNTHGALVSHFKLHHKFNLTYFPKNN
jgi:hypothetical protein